MKPFQHQIEDTAILIDHPFHAILNEMGTGKSKTIIDAVEVMREKKEVECCIIFCPKTVISSWISNHLSEHADITHSHPYLTLNKWVHKIDRKNFFYLVINYESVRNKINLEVIKYLLENYKTVWILDESQKIANYDAKMTKNILSICHMAERRYIMSGTPIRNNPLNYYSQFKFLDDEIIPLKSYYAFKNYISITGGYRVNGRPVQTLGFKNLDKLKSWVDPYVIRRTKKECLDLPDKLYTVIPIEMTDQQKKVYKEMETYSMSVIGDAEVTAQIKLTQVLKLRQITAGFLKDDESYYNFGTDRYNVLDDMFERGNKVVIFCIFHKEIEDISAKLEKLGKTYTTISGKVTGGERTERINDFQAGKYDAIVLQVEAGGVGIDLYRAHTAVYFSNAYNWDTRDQSESRIHRIGQVNHCQYIDVVSTYNGKKTIDHDILECVRKKKKFADYMLMEDNSLGVSMNGEFKLT